MQDPNLGDEERQQIRSDLVRVLRQGQDGTLQVGGHAYRFTGLTNEHAAFTRADLVEAITGQEQYKYFFRNGEQTTHFNDFKRFGRAIDAAKKSRTEGEDIRSLFGTDMSQVRVVVGDLKAISGIDGQNMMDRSLVPESFQGRAYGSKSTYQVVQMEELRRLYAN